MTQAVNPSTLSRRARRNRWLLLAPALIILIGAAIGPLLVVAVYSVLTPGDYGGVVLTLSPDGWSGVFAKRDLFDGTWQLADAHVAILWRSVKLALLTTLFCLIMVFPLLISSPRGPSASAICGCCLSPSPSGPTF